MSNNLVDHPSFLTFEAAKKDCLTTSYEYENLVNVVIRKNIIFQENNQQNVEFELGSLRTIAAIGLVLGSSKKINVLDFGGGGGYHWALSKKAFNKDIAYDWRVLETPLMAMVANKTLLKNGLSFFSDISTCLADGVKMDLIFMSSALQYCEKPLQILKEVVNLGAKYLFITRTPFSLAPKTLISKQRSLLSENGPGPLPKEFKDEIIEYPITYVLKTEVEEILSQKYKIRFVLQEDVSTLFYGSFPVNGYYGYFCEIK